MASGKQTSLFRTLQQRKALMVILLFIAGWSFFQAVTWMLSHKPTSVVTNNTSGGIASPSGGEEIEKYSRQISLVLETLSKDVKSMRKELSKAKSESNSEPKSESDSEPKSESKSEPSSESKSEPSSDSKTHAAKSEDSQKGSTDETHLHKLDDHQKRHFLEIESLESVKIRENEPKVLILTTSKRSTTRMPEPSSDKDPLIWTLELLPHPELEVYRALDRLQHDQASGNCAANGQSKYWCSGWPLSLVFPDVCKESHKKFVKAWHYAADACEAKDLSCYFLNYTSCPRPEKFDKSKEMFDLKRTIPDKFESLFSNHHALKGKSTVKLWDVHNAAPGEFYNFLLYMYLTRMRYWVRQEVMKRVEEFKLKEPCAVMHAKDSKDAVGIKTIFLMTDSGDVIDETKKHPEFEWRWMEKHRFRRNEKINFENQFPSGSPKEESIALLTLFHLASECRLFIGGVSGFGTLAYRYMCLLHTKNVWDCPPHRVVDQHKAYTGMHDNPDPRHNKSSEHFGKKAVKYSGYTETDKEGVPYPEEVKGSPEHKQMQNHKKEEAKRQK
ncbi:hypothetical protein AAMO2058_001433500 [Amorphochlora amoebiformis]